ncbi:uncharacterized protein LOC119560651 isoform X1 [Drosophila subpulchrella]|uniref:uncharacterized protein LOC119560651 isoform X1 n=1 Tax=Drosophila subpulchrella TaxID=1486046 RepID=UPI0018A145F6|nr:uncharacterized protein LOC119560651 isoform X1 [Drosophila subpulchrella]
MYSAQEETNQKKRQPVPSNRLQLFNLKSGSVFLKFAPETSKEYLRLNDLKNRSFNAKRFPRLVFEKNAIDKTRAGLSKLKILNCCVKKSNKKTFLREIAFQEVSHSLCTQLKNRQIRKSGNQCLRIVCNYST